MANAGHPLSAKGVVRKNAAHSFFLSEAPAELDAGDAVEKRRIAIGAFMTGESVNHALDDLLAAQSGDMRICLVAERAAFSGDLEAMLEDRKDADGIGLVLIGGDPSETEVNSDAAPDCPILARLEEWLEPRMAAILRHHLSEGGCLLFVRVDASAVEKSVCRTLIRNSEHQVQVHDIFIRH